MVIILMPAEKELPCRFDPADPIAVTTGPSLYVEADLKSCLVYWIPSIIKKLSWVGCCDDTVWPRFS
jgi:hypothetical protein